MIVCPFIAWMENVSRGEMGGHLRISLLSRTASTSPSPPTATCTHWPSPSLDSVPLAVVVDPGLGGNNTHISEKRVQRGRNCMERAWHGFDLFRRNGESVRTLRSAAGCPSLPSITPSLASISRCPGSPPPWGKECWDPHPLPSPASSPLRGQSPAGHYKLCLG